MSIQQLKLKKMKTLILTLILTTITLICSTYQVTAQQVVGPINVIWEDACLPAVNNTDLYYVELKITKNSDGSGFCNSPYFTPLPYLQYTASSFQWEVGCNCYDTYYGYHVAATVIRYDQYYTEICRGVTEFDISCENLDDLTEIKVNLPS